jgi:carbon-monoxide dehydrogenase small subunit
LLAEAYLAARGAAGAGEPTEAEIRELAASNLCRCTGYQGIVDAVLATARARYHSEGGTREGRAGGSRAGGSP